MNTKIHTLKTIDTCWDAVERGDKMFEVRRNDRFFQSGDTVILRRVDGGGSYTPGRERFSTKDLSFRIGWMLHGGQFGIAPGYVIFQLEKHEQAT